MLPFLLLLSLATADVISEEEAVCRDAQAGETCRTDGVRGICRTTTCSRLDYSQGTPPTSVTYECLRCFPPGVDPNDPDAANARSTGCDTAAARAASWPVGPVSLLLGLGIAGVMVGRRRREG